MSFLVGLVWGIAMLLSGRAVYAALGAGGPALKAAVLYSNVLFLGAIPLWLFNAAASVLRGCGNTVYPAAAGAALGVVVLAVGIIAATSYRHQAELPLHKGSVVAYDGHRFEFEGLRTVTSPSRTAQEAVVQVDGAAFYPATTSFGSALSVVGTPAIDSGFFDDVYLTFDAVGGLGASSGNQAINNLPKGSVAIGVVIEPLVVWLWAGGLLIGVGGVLALIPGSRRRPTDPTSAASDLVTGAAPEHPRPRETAPEPVGALVARGATGPA